MSLRRFLTSTLLAVLIGSVSLGAIYLYNFDLNSFRVEIETLASERLAKSVSLGEARFSIKHGPAFAFDNVIIGATDDDLYLNVKKVFFRLKTLPLLFGEILFSEILLEEPDIAIRIEKNRPEGTRALLKKRLLTGELVNSLRLRNGTIRITALRGSGEPEKIIIENLQLSINEFSLKRAGRINATATLVYHGIRSPLSVEGQYHPTEETTDWTNTFYRFEIAANNLAAEKLTPLFQGMKTDLALQGYADIGLQFKGSLQKGSTFALNISGNGLELTTSPKTTHTAVLNGNLSGRVRYANNEIGLEEVKLTLETGHGSLEIDNRSRFTLADNRLAGISSNGRIITRQSTAGFFADNLTAAYQLNLRRTKTGWETTEGALTLPGLELMFNGHWSDNGDQPFSLALAVPETSLTSVTTMMPGLKHLKLSGQFAVNLKLSGTATGPLRTIGTLQLANAHLAIPGKLADLNNLSGNIKLDGRTLVAKGLQAKLGKSPITVDLQVPDLTVADLTLRVLSDSIRADELIFSSKKRYLRQIDGIVRLADNTVFLGPIHVKMAGGTDATVNGTVRNFAAPEITLDIQGRHGNLDEIIALWEHNKSGPTATKHHRKSSLTIDINTDSGQIAGLFFDQATAQIVMRNNILVISPIRFRAGAGEGLGQVLLIRQDDGSSLLKMSGNVTDFDAQTVYNQLLKRPGLVSGRLSGNFYLEGLTGKQFLPTSLGAFSVKIEDGRLYKLTGLAKILHILNLYPLLTENVQGKGLPYSTISFNAVLSQGILATEDLLLQGDIMNISMTGQHNLLNSTVDFDLAAMPLRSVDSILSRIPIAGWLLTGDQKALLVANFKINGDADDPEVTSVPIKSLTAPVLGILKRVLTFPVKIVTDPEKVIINK